MINKRKGISLITLIVTIVVVIIIAATIILVLAKTNVIKNADMAVFKQDAAVVQDMLNLQIADITLDSKEPPELYTDETYTEKVVDRVQINKENIKIGKLYYATSKEKGCIVFGREALAKVKNKTEIATNGIPVVENIVYRYTEEDLPTYKDKYIKWYVTSTNRVVFEMDEIILDGSIRMDEPGIYKMTVNAGSKADWVGIEVRDLVMPEGSNIIYSFETSDDRETYDQSVSNIEEAVDSQYLRVQLTLVPNSKGECPTLTSVRVKFKTEDEIIIEEPVLEDVAEIEYMGQTMYKSNINGGKISQIVNFGESQSSENTKIKVPVVINGKTEYLSNTNTTVPGANLKIYGSQDGVSYTEINTSTSNISGYKHLKYEVVAQNNVVVGKTEVNIEQKEAETEWITTKTEYYEVDAQKEGKWISIEKDEEIENNTRIIYSFTKSNDDSNWTEYSQNIEENGNSRYLKVKVEYQKISEEIKREAKLNELIINYEVDGESKKRYLKSEKDRENPTKPKDLDLVVSGRNVKVLASGSTDDFGAIQGYQYKIGDGEWSDIQTGEYEFKNLILGVEYTIYARSVDGVNKVSEEISKKITIPDTEAPSAPTKIDVSISNAVMKIKASGSTDNSGTIQGYQYKVGSGAWSNTTNGEYTASGLVTGGQYTLYARAVDNSNNVSKEFSKIQKMYNKLIYVSKSGSDSNGNGTSSKPYATIYKAITSAISGDAIYITAGEYQVPMIYWDYYESSGILDYSKQLEIYGDNEKTVLYMNGNTTSSRDENVIHLDNPNSVVRNLVCVFTPKNSSNNYSRAIFRWCNGTIQNVLIRVRTRSASYLYYNDQRTWTPIINCTFVHDSGWVDGNYSGQAAWTDCAFNVAHTGYTYSVFSSSSMTLSQIITKCKNDTTFNNKKAGVYYGDYAWSK